MSGAVVFGDMLSNESFGAVRLSCLDLVELPRLMAITTGAPHVKVALIDGPVATDHPDLAAAAIQDVTLTTPGRCQTSSSFACMHGTVAAGILCARRGSRAPAICPNCTLLLRPIFSETARDGKPFIPTAAPEELAVAIRECVDAGARVLNLSLALGQVRPIEERAVDDALGYASQRGSLVVAASGNQGSIGSSAITRHPWVIPVVAYDQRRKPLGLSNLAGSIGRGGIGAPGDNVVSLTASGKSMSAGGTSVAAPFVTGAIALLASEFPKAAPSEIRDAVMQPSFRRTTVVPPLLDAWAAYRFLQHRQR